MTKKAESESFFETLRLKVSLQCSSPSQAESKTIRLCVLFKSCKIFFNTSIVNAKKFSRTGTHVRVIMLLGFLLDNDLPTYVINPLHTNLYRKSQTLRKTKTDRVDARTIASMLMSDVSLKPYTNIAYHNSELKSLTRYRFDKVSERSKLKTSVTRLVNILFPELEKLLPTLHTASSYALLSELPGAKHIAETHLTHLTNLLYTASKGHYGKDKAVQIREAARNSIGTYMPAKALELKHTIKLIKEFNNEIDEIESAIQVIMDKIDSPITTIPGISLRMGAMIIAEIGDFNNFDSPDKILAFAGLSPSTYQSGQLNNCYAHMEKRGSRYLRYALFNATKYVCNWNNESNSTSYKNLDVRTPLPVHGN